MFQKLSFFLILGLILGNSNFAYAKKVGEYGYSAGYCSFACQGGTDSCPENYDYSQGQTNPPACIWGYSGGNCFCHADQNHAGISEQTCYDTAVATCGAQSIIWGNPRILDQIAAIEFSPRDTQKEEAIKTEIQQILKALVNSQTKETK